MDTSLMPKTSFTIHPGLHCLFSGMYHILELERPEAAAASDEAEIYFETNGLNLEYHGDLNRVWLASQQDIAQRLADTYGLKLQASFAVERDPDPALQLLRQAVLQGRLPLLFVRTTALDYHEVFRDGKERNHIVLLLGWDDSSGTVRIGDTSFLNHGGHVMTYEGQLTIEALRLGLWGYAWFEACADRQVYADRERRRAALRNIEAYVQGLELPGERYQGRLAYRMYVRALDQLPALEDTAFSAVCRNVYYCYRVGGMLHQLDYLTIFLERNRWSLTQDNQELVSQLDGLKAQWRKTLMQLYKIGLTVQREKVGPLQARFDQLLDEHEHLLRQLLGVACEELNADEA